MKNRNELNVKCMLINEKYEVEIKIDTRKGFISLTKNCLISVLVSESNSTTRFVPVNKTVELLKVRHCIKGKIKPQMGARER